MKYLKPILLSCLVGLSAWAGAPNSPILYQFATTNTAFNLTNIIGSIAGSNAVVMSTNANFANFSHYVMDVSSNQLNGLNITNATSAWLQPWNVLTNGESINTVLSNALYVYGKIHTTFPIDGVIGTSNANVLYVDTAGDDSSALKGIPYRPWHSIETAASNAVVGDTIVVNQGTYQTTNGIFLPLGGAKLVGIGKPVIQNYATNLAAEQVFGVVLTDNSIVDNVAVSNMFKSTRYQVALGTHYLLGWGTTMTNVVLKNVTMDGDSDCFFVRHTNTVSLAMYDCRAYSKWDAMVLAHTGSSVPVWDWSLYNCSSVIYADSVFNPAYSYTHAVGVSDDGTSPIVHLNIFGGDYTSTNSQGQVVRLDSTGTLNANSTINILGANLVGTKMWFYGNDLGTAKIRVTGGLQRGAFINGSVTSIGDLGIQGDSVYGIPNGIAMVDTPDVTDGFATWTNRWGPDGGLTLGGTNLAGKANLYAVGNVSASIITNRSVGSTKVVITDANGKEVGATLANMTLVGTTLTALGGAGSQTPWTSDINGAGFSLTNVGNLQASSMNITGTLSTPNLLVTNDITASTMTLSNGPLTVIGPGTVHAGIILTNPGAASQIRIYQPDGAGFAALTAGNLGTFTLSTSNGPALTLTNYAALFRSNVFASAFINYSNPAVGLSALTPDALSISNTPSGNQLVLTNGGAQFSAPVTTTTSTTNDPSNLEFPVAGWVRGLFNNGILDYASAATAIGFTNADSPNQVVYMFTNAIPPSSVRVWASAFLTNNGYVGSVTTTNRFKFINGPAVINAYLGLSSGGGDALSVNPELYYSYDGTNWLGDYDCQPQALTAGRTNLYQFVITFPQITATNTTGFFVERRLKVRSVGGTPTMYFMVGTNIVSGTNNASHIAFSGPSSETIPSPLLTNALGCTFASGSALTPGSVAQIPIPYDCTALDLQIIGYPAGAAVLDLKDCTVTGNTMTVGSSIVASAPPTIAATSNGTNDLILSGWTTALSARHSLQASVTSCTTITNLTLTIRVTHPR